MADWSAYLAALSVPVLVIAAIGHRAALLASSATYGAIALGFTLAGLAVAAALAAFVVIWRDGVRGVGTAIRGCILGLVILTMPAIGAWKIVTDPRLTDISTDLTNPPHFEHAYFDRSPDDATIVEPGPAEAAAQKEAYPDIVPRHYPVSTARVYLEAKAIIDRRGWQILSAQEPTEQNPNGSIEAVAMTLVFAFRQDVIIRLVPDGDGTRVDMRSAARNAAHDLGSDADRVRSFFKELDGALEGVSGTS
ncbi:MAG TPA: DUF1499 domain-containing protein [Bauldia sp.]|nr:DUF1499 domain-containing protein [Bauldia sp.]